MRAYLFNAFALMSLSGLPRGLCCGPARSPSWGGGLAGWGQRLRTQPWAVPCSPLASDLPQQRPHLWESHLSPESFQISQGQGAGWQNLRWHCAAKHMQGCALPRVIDVVKAKCTGRCFSGLLPQCSVWTETSMSHTEFGVQEKVDAFIFICLGIKLSST